jgi:hypothetical protein
MSGTESKFAGREGSWPRLQLGEQQDRVQHREQEQGRDRQLQDGHEDCSPGVPPTVSTRLGAESCTGAERKGGI